MPQRPEQTGRFGVGDLTHVTVEWHQGEREDWLRFGKPVAHRIIDRRRRIESYAEGQVFALVRWAANGWGTIRSDFAIVQALAQTAPCERLPQVEPGGEILLQVRGWSRVKRVFAVIDALEADGFDPCEAAPDYWRHVHNRLLVRQEPRAYTAERHTAWLMRRRLQP